MKLAITLAATVALVAAPTASAVPYGGSTAEQRPVVLNVSKSGRQVVLARTALDITCSDGSTDFAPDGWKGIPIDRRGNFEGEFADQPGTSFDDKPMVSSGSLTGKLNARRRTISGTWRIDHRVTQPDGSVVTCTSGAVKFTAAAKSDRRPPRQGYFGAFSTADYPVVLQVARSGRSVTSARAAFELKCSKGGYRFVTDGWVRLTVSAAGKFKAAVTDVQEKFSDGSPYKISSSISGSFDRTGRKVTGTWTVRWEVPEADGTTDICESGPVRFTVKR